jgi:hypothetical protein
MSSDASPVSLATLPNGDYKWSVLDYGAYGYGSWATYQNFKLTP